MVWFGSLVETPREKSSIECAVNLSYSANFFQNNEWRHLFGSPVNDPGRPKNDPAARPDKNLVTRVIIFRVIFFVTRAMARVLLTRATALSWFVKSPQKMNSTVELELNGAPDHR